MPMFDAPNPQAPARRKYPPRPGMQTFKDAGGEWRWRTRAANGEITATSEGYTRRTDAKRGFEDHCRIIREITTGAIGSHE